MPDVLKQAGLAAALLAGLAGGAAAKSPLLKCEMTRNGAYQGTPRQLVVDYQAGESRMWVYDSLMKYYELDPVLARLRRDDAKTLSLRWSLEDVDLGNRRSIIMRYSLNWSKTTGQAPGSDVNGTGRCTWIARKTGNKI